MPQRRPPEVNPFESELSAFLVQPDGTRAPLPASLRFDRADPFAVSLLLRTSTVQTVTWTFARQLLIDGARRPTGVGAVEVRPAFHDGTRLVVLSLKSASRHTQVQLRHDQVATFMGDVLAAVPAGTEGDHVDWSAELDRFRGPDS
ncbi:SsgA family sporulation/cell division regulator [Frankia gtarii]|uniref:SsgA family sporulation/cell division regulator n=1 Tax=Frankia gtarii TaxID=2950102 RepID=UPI0021C2220A|nr:SsgA family sporulation/cell division regulator [Frankia gtarii]